MIPVNHHKRALENFIVAGSATTLYNSTGSGTNLTDSNGNVVLAANQLGFFSTAIFGPLAMNVATDATPTIAECPSIALYQGTSESLTSNTATATYPLNVRPYEMTESLQAGTQVFVTKQIYRAPSFATTVIGKTSGTGSITAVGKTEYQMTFSYRGRMIDLLFSKEESAYDRFTYTTPDYVALGTVSGTDHLLQNLAYQANLGSRVLNLGGNARKASGSYVVLALGASGTLISGITAGSFVPVVNLASGVKGFNPTADQLASIQAAAVAASFTHIVTIDTLTAGGAATVKGLMIVALDRVLSFQDYIPQVKLNIKVSLTAGFDSTVYNTQLVKPDEGQGIGRVLDLQYKATQGQRKYNNRHVDVPITEYPSPVDPLGKYNTYVIHHSHEASIGIAQTSVSPYKEIILVPTANTTLSSASGATGTLDVALAAWLASNNNPPITIIV